ncbi:putative DNA repair protein RecN [Parvularcula bermudensis HTCC2503]|uniref:DNA repair protein RecN n=1 Tax=Parvularcula bermudensis (strain ATCC BAA-594 / HTCC2503 / KCTC 12087) TaxID=314260 RepID=E0TCU1_PARBH|nr:DNA repair protein RecN [Parvularcula bermudensis]ADM09880.1 putative DNA repair protein RecN [Parvularcula bermudensis HTCC2503]
MLVNLHVQDIVLIAQLRLSIGAGLTALTGETGAGKSILLDSLGLATGGKADRSLVRHGAERGIVAATFDVDRRHEVWAALEEGGLSTEDDTITLRRIQYADGKSRAFINDQPCSVGLLRAVGGRLIEIHGQHQALGFLDERAHRQLLDHFGGHEEALRAVQSADAAHRAAIASLDAAMSADRRLHEEADYLRHMAEELSALAPQAGEEAQLAERRAVLMAAEKIGADLDEAAHLLEEDGPTRRLSTAAAQLERAAARLTEEGGALLQAAVGRIDAALAEFEAARDAVNLAAGHFAGDPEELNAIEERLFALRAAARKYQRPTDALVPLLNEVRAALRDHQESEGRRDDLEVEVRKTKAQYDVATAALTAARRRAARRLESDMAKELRPLKLDRTRFVVELSATEAGPTGTDRVRFMVSTNPGQPPGPLGSIASGGELSRFVLALKAVLVAREGRTVIIFDEVDAGVGGAVADAVGERLAGIASASQVLVVTHSPQVAARGAAHFQVSKTGKHVVETTVRHLTAEERVEEIARMLSGAKITDAAREAAKALLSASGKKPKKKRAA